MRLQSVLFLVYLLSLPLSQKAFPQNGSSTSHKTYYKSPAEIVYSSALPYTRWWWFADKIKHSDIKAQLDMLKKNNFGGVEIAFIYPVNRNPRAERFAFLGPEWQDAVRYAKQYADSIGLGCDFTFGTLWPFGGLFVNDSDRTQIWNNPKFKQPLRLSWTHPDTGNVLNHLSRSAFNRYAGVMGKALAPALAGKTSALFCDSWEVETKYLWTRGFDTLFSKRFGYDIRPFMDSIYSVKNSRPRADYMKLLSTLVIDEFYKPFTEYSHTAGSISRAQCSGAPADIISAYASVDVPESEAMLYEPAYSKIVASAAALADKKIVSSETFTCMYGFPGKYIRKEQVADLRIVADALFANGVNQIIWHGMPYNPAGVDTQFFYASVHIGSAGSLYKDLAPFNRYMQKVSEYMRKGNVYTDIAVYLPLEDARIAGEYPKELQLPWSWGAYEMRYVRFNDELRGYHPLWINQEFLSKGVVEGKKFKVNNLSFKALYIDAEYWDLKLTETLYGIAKQGIPIIVKRPPKESDYILQDDFGVLLELLFQLPNVKESLSAFPEIKPLITGDNLPEFFCREEGDELIVFLANPLVSSVKYPVKYGQSQQLKDISVHLKINYKGKSVPVNPVFSKGKSKMYKISAKGNITEPDIDYTTPDPVTEP